MTRRRRYRWSLGWDAKVGLGRFTLFGTFCPSSINLPRLSWERYDEGGFVALSWGNGNSDPLWSISVQW